MVKDEHQDGKYRGDEHRPEALAKAPPKAHLKPRLLTYDDLGDFFGRSHRSIRRAVERGELPEPARLAGRWWWTWAAIVAHQEKRMAERQKACGGDPRLQRGA